MFNNHKPGNNGIEQGYQGDLQEEIASDLTAMRAQAAAEREAMEGTQAAEKPHSFWRIWGPILAFLLTFAVTYIVFALVLDKGVAEAPVVAKPPVTAPVNSVGAHTVVCRNITYDLCGHVVSDNLTNEQEFVDKTYDQLTTEGWQVAELGPGKLEVNKHQAGLCPDDAKRRVVKRTERGVAVYAGTAHATGEMLMEMPVLLSELPADWQKQLADGGVEFDSEARLYEVMESFDELIDSGSSV